MPNFKDIIFDRKELNIEFPNKKLKYLSSKDFSFKQIYNNISSYLFKFLQYLKMTSPSIVYFQTEFQ